MPDTSSTAFPQPLDGNCIKDIHRKLASIRDQLEHDLSDEGLQFLRGRSSDSVNPGMRDAIRAFKKKFMSDAAADEIIDARTWAALTRVAGCTFAEAWQYELDGLNARRTREAQEASPLQPPPVDESADLRALREDEAFRTRHDPVKTESVGSLDDFLMAASGRVELRPADEDLVIRRAHREELAGLAFSGGGIRSATFNLGMLQALSERGRLRDFDYLSTVSGGGYIGGWFSRWLRRDMGNLDAVANAMSPGTKTAPKQQEADEVRFLRQYSNYLTPKTGLFSADTWALLATYFRNTALNMTILVTLLGGVLIVPRLLSFLAVRLDAQYPLECAIAGGAAALWAVAVIAYSISSTPDPVTHQWRHGQSQGRILMFVVLPLLLSAFVSSIAAWHYRANFVRIWNLIPPTGPDVLLSWVIVPGCLYFLAWAAGWGTAQWRNGGLSEAATMVRQSVREGFGHFLCALIALGVGMLLLTWSVTKFAQWQLAAETIEGPAKGMLLVSYGMPFMLCIFGITIILAVGLVGRMYHDKSREWWSRQGGWTAICTLVWFALAAVSLYAPPILGYLYANLSGWWQALFGGGWAAMTMAGLKLGQSSATGKRDARAYLEWIAGLAPLVFSVGALFLTSTAVYFMMTRSVVATGWGGPDFKGWDSAFTTYFTVAGQITGRHALLVMVCLLVAGLFLAARVDVNKFSLYMMYRNRLVRAYLGASHAGRNPNPFTGFDPKDDLDLDKLLGTGGVMQRPFPIFNTALNLVSGQELAWQNRKAAGFSFTPAFCGFELPRMASPGRTMAAQEAERGCFRPTAGYRETKDAGGDEETGVKLGMAMAISGAAVSPNMGYHSSPALSFLMTLFNVRLGRWFANPRHQHWARPAPRSGILYLLSELFGMSDADASFVYLSDGGHFENLGIYELVRRRCRLIVVIDASADGQLDFEDLGNAIRKCATDLHIEIDIDARLLVPESPGGFSSAQCVVGDILYDRTDSGAINGTLLYIKPTLLDTEFAEVLNYRKAHKDFPHQSTADQWFDETQFESYRSLGYRIGMAVFDLPPPPDDGSVSKPGGSYPIPGLADALRAKWGSKKKGVAATVPVTPQTVGT